MRQNYAKAAGFFETICFTYAECGWNAIDVTLVERYTICQRQLGQTKDLLKSYVYLIQHPEHLKMETLEFYFQQFRLICEESKEAYKSIDCKVIEVSGVVLKEAYQNTDSVGLDLTFESHLPDDFMVDKITVTYSAGDGQSIEFTASNVRTREGRNLVACCSKVCHN